MADSDLGDRLLQAIHAASGVYPGHRAAHAKGLGVTGTFTSSGDAAPLTTAAHLQPGVTVAVTARFSNGGANPLAPDSTRDGRGFAVRFHLDAPTDIVALTLPVFFVRNPEDFIELTVARRPDPETGAPDLDKILAFLGAHPEAQRAAELSISAPFPVSYAQTRYFGIHGFWFVDADGARHKVRYRWEPDAGVATLGDEEAGAQDPDYLQAELASRVGAAPAAFTLHVQVGEDGDDVDDPTVAWPDERRSVEAGRLELVEIADRDTVEKLIFDPTRVTPGIECSDDQILHARAAAYGASYAARTAAG